MKIPVRRINHKLVKMKLEQALKDALKDKDATLALMVKAQLRQYQDRANG